MKALSATARYLLLVQLLFISAYANASCIGVLNSSGSSSEKIAKSLSLNEVILKNPGSLLSHRGSQLVFRRSIKDKNEYQVQIFDLEKRTWSASFELPVVSVRSYATEDAGIPPIFDVHLQPKGNLALVVNDLEYTIWDTSTGTLVRKLDTKTDLRNSTTANNPIWSPNGRLLIFPDKENKQLKIFDTQTGKETILVNNWFFEASMFKLRSDGKELAIVEKNLESNGNVLIYTLSETGELIGKPIRVKRKGFLNRTDYAYWDGPYLVLANNFDMDYFEMDTKKYIGSFSSYQPNFGNNPTRIWYTMERQITNPPPGVPEVRNKGITSPVMNPDMLDDEPSFQYKALGQYIALMTYGPHGLIQYLNKNGERLLTFSNNQRSHENFGPKDVQIESFSYPTFNQVIGDQLYLYFDGQLKSYTIELKDDHN